MFRSLHFYIIFTANVAELILVTCLLIWIFQFNLLSTDDSKNFEVLAWQILSFCEFISIHEIIYQIVLCIIYWYKYNFVAISAQWKGINIVLIMQHMLGREVQDLLVAAYDLLILWKMMFVVEDFTRWELINSLLQFLTLRVAELWLEARTTH